MNATLIRVASVAATLVLACGPVAAQNDAAGYPNRAVTLIVPFAPGGGTDTGARLIGQKLSQKWGQPIVIDNRAGAGGIIGVEAVARAKPDGYTLLMGNVGTQAINPPLYGKLPYDAEAGFAPISMVAELPLALVAHPGFKANTTKELVATAKANPGKLTIANSGTGNSTHLAAEIFKAAAGVDMLSVPYKGGGPANADVISGQVDMQFTSVFGATGLISSGKMRPIAVASERRSLALPNVPTLKEAGIPNAEMASWIGVLAPAGTPDAIVEKISADIREIVQSPEVHDSLVTQGATPRATTAAEFARVIAADQKRFNELVRRLGVRAN